MDLQETLFWKHRDDLLRILTVLWRMAGLSGATTIRQSLRTAVARLLRPAEAATRRLIVVLARRIAVTLKPARMRPRANREQQAAREPNAQPEAGWREFALADPLPRRRAGFAGFPCIVAGPDREIDASRLVLRFDALNHALDDLQAQARRMARWMALRKRARARGKFRSATPLRPGPPADLRGEARRRLKGHELFAILEDAHRRAWWSAGAAADTG